MIKLIQMILEGITEINLCRQRNYHRRIKIRSLPTAYVRWVAIGKRFQNAMSKVGIPNR